MWNKLLSGVGNASSIGSCSESCVAVIDLNNLKLLNNRLGQEEGERLIGIAGDVLLSVARKACKVYKTSGELFLD
ncbi:diguanylate cyclase domain-containing protein [Synechococcus sp. MIT S9509]|uniref:diguanylate cyclase domain-containing protein n=1 Tax=Synechococcus sp. MIT S9509 TaxID=1801630 RepID=UPI000941688D